MIRYVTKNDEGQILSMMELVKDDFAGYKEKEFLNPMKKSSYPLGLFGEEMRSIKEDYPFSVKK